MKTLNTKLRLILLFSIACIVPANAQTETMKVITYNIMNGFNWGKDTARQTKVAAWIRNQKPDVVALQELCDYTPERLQKEAAQWGHPYSVLLKTKGYSVGLTSNRPVRTVEKLVDGLWHGMLHCETWGIDFFVVHLSPSDCSIRRGEAETITNRLKSTAINPDQCIVLGDYNSQSPFDDDLYQSRPELLARYLESDKKDGKYQNLRDGHFDYSVIGRFLSLPLIDLCQKYVAPARRYSFPSPILVGTWETPEGVENHKERIDYIMATPKLAVKCIDARIGNTFETALFSDHYPVTAVFVLEK